MAEVTEVAWWQCLRWLSWLALGRSGDVGVLHPKGVKHGWRLGHGRPLHPFPLSRHLWHSCSLLRPRRYVSLEAGHLLRPVILYPVILPPYTVVSLCHRHPWWA